MLPRVQKIISYFLRNEKNPFVRASGDEKPSFSRKRQTEKILPEQDFDSRLRKILSAQGRISAGKIQIISLDKIREFVAGDWNEFSGKVREVITSTIMKRLGPKDSFTQAGNDSYIIVFDSLSKEDAELECVLIVQEVLRTLFVDRHLDDRVDIRTVAVGVDGKIHVEQVDLLDIIVRLLQEEQDVVEKAIRRRSASDPAAQRGASQADLVDSMKRDAELGSKKYICYFDSVIAALPKDIRFHYKPYWDVRRKVLSMYSCIVTDGQNTGYDILGKGPDPMLIPALDYVVISRVLHEMNILYSKGSRLLVCCPVHIDTLADAKAWGTYRLLCERFSGANLKRDIVFEIFGVGEDTDSSKIIYCSSKLQPYCKNMIIRTDLSNNSGFRKFDSGAFDALCADAGTYKSSERRMMKSMDDFAENARMMKLNAYITGLDRLSQVTAAVGSGFCKVSGPAVHGPIEKPEFIFKFEAQNLLSRFSG